jgi:hypothetical protein
LNQQTGNIERIEAPVEEGEVIEISSEDDDSDVIITGFKNSQKSTQGINVSSDSTHDRSQTQSFLSFGDMSQIKSLEPVSLIGEHISGYLSPDSDDGKIISNIEEKMSDVTPGKPSISLGDTSLRLEGFSLIGEQISGHLSTNSDNEKIVSKIGEKITDMLSEEENMENDDDNLSFTTPKSPIGFPVTGGLSSEDENQNFVVTRQVKKKIRGIGDMVLSSIEDEPDDEDEYFIKTVKKFQIPVSFGYNLLKIEKDNFYEHMELNDMDKVSGIKSYNKFLVEIGGMMKCMTSLDPGDKINLHGLVKRVNDGIKISHSFEISQELELPATLIPSSCKGNLELENVNWNGKFVSRFNVTEVIPPLTPLGYSCKFSTNKSLCLMQHYNCNLGINWKEDKWNNMWKNFNLVDTEAFYMDDLRRMAHPKKRDSLNTKELMGIVKTIRSLNVNKDVHTNFLVSSSLMGLHRHWHEDQNDSRYKYGKRNNNFNIVDCFPCQLKLYNEGIVPVNIGFTTLDKWEDYQEELEDGKKNVINKKYTTQLKSYGKFINYVKDSKIIKDGIVFLKELLGTDNWYWTSSYRKNQVEFSKLLLDIKKKEQEHNFRQKIKAKLTKHSDLYYMYRGEFVENVTYDSDEEVEGEETEHEKEIEQN